MIYNSRQAISRTAKTNDRVLENLLPCPKASKKAHNKYAKPQKYMSRDKI